MNSHWLRVSAYDILVVPSLIERRRERSQADEVDGVWVGMIIEMTLLIITGLVTLWVPEGRSASAENSSSRRTLGARS